MIVDSIRKIIKFILTNESSKPKETAFEYCKRTGVSYERLRGIAYGQGKVWLPDLTEEQKKELE